MHSMTKSELEEACRSIAATCACSTARLASLAVTRFYDAVLAPSGLRATEFIVLVGVFRGFGTTVTELGRALGMDAKSLAKILRPLYRRGIVRTVQGGRPRRRTLRTTKQGDRLLARAIPYWRRAQQQVVTTVGEEKWAALGSELRGLTRAIARRGSDEEISAQKMDGTEKGSHGARQRAGQ